MRRLARLLLWTLALLALVLLAVPLLLPYPRAPATVPPEQLAGGGVERSSETMRERVAAAAAMQRKRYEGVPAARRNADLTLSAAKRFCAMDAGAAGLLAGAQKSLMFSARSRRNIVQVARTIADLAGEERISVRALAEAVQYRAYEGRRFVAG